MLKKTPVILLILVIFAFSCGSFLPLPILRTFLAISITLKSVVIFMLPLLIFGLLFSTFQHLGQDASRAVIVTLILLCISNFIATYVGHFVGRAVYSMDLALTQAALEGELLPIVDWQLPKLMPNALAMALGILGGIFIPKIIPNHIQKLSHTIDALVAQMLKGISLIIPPFLFGFLLKMHHDGLVSILIRRYAPIVVVTTLIIVAYVFLFYLVANSMNPKKSWASMRNMFPSIVCAFGSMSSAATLPYTLTAVEKNATNKSLARSVASITVNVHLIGDCIIVPTFIYAVLKSYGLPQPSVLLYLSFAIQFVIAKFSVAAVPGGTIIVMLPVIERCFGFDGAMSSFIFSLCILMEPIGTSANVLGNGAFAQLIDRLTQRFKLVKDDASVEKFPSIS